MDLSNTRTSTNVEQGAPVLRPSWDQALVMALSNHFRGTSLAPAAPAMPTPQEINFRPNSLAERDRIAQLPRPHLAPIPHSSPTMQMLDNALRQSRRMAITRPY